MMGGKFGDDFNSLVVSGGREILVRPDAWFKGPPQVAMWVSSEVETFTQQVNLYAEALLFSTIPA